jgi:hypothetical protein
MLTESGKNLEETIKQAINDHMITNSEYEEILRLLHADGVTDAHERILMQELHNLIADGSVKRVPG